MAANFNKNKGNFNRNNNNNNYFSQGIQQGGQNFLANKDADAIQKDAFTIFRQLAQGKIDVERNLNYFSSSHFLENCLITANKKWNYHSISRMGIECYLRFRQQDPTFTQMEYETIDAIWNEQKKSEIAYSILLQGLSNYRSTINEYTPSGDVNCLIIMTGSLSPYRNNL